MKRFLLLAIASLFLAHEVSAFCGFYVAKADATLFNKSSQVILVRDGDHTTITMSNDFQGDVKDFAMVVPVPVVLKKEQIKTVNPNLFAKIDAATAPRLSAYYDNNPCNPPVMMESIVVRSSTTRAKMSADPGTRPTKPDYKVTVEAKYEVGEYDILILSAQESSGLEAWLIDNGYKIPTGAQEVLEPYVKSNLKFFVVKVNMEKHQANGFQQLTPLQISFQSPRFMLPIRLGMANANGDQDLIVYSFTRKGRIEPTNYRMAEMPHDREVPLFVQNEFGKFYKDAFEVNWKREGRNALMLEYAWDISGSQPVKCDPCPSPLLTYSDLTEAGVTWISTQDPKWGQGLYTGDLFVTRLHARYNRQTFPQDLAFQTTPNSQNFQCRYVIHYPANGDLSCEEGQDYIQTLTKRRNKELQEMNHIAGWDIDKHLSYAAEYQSQLKKKNTDKKKDFAPIVAPSGPPAKGPGIGWIWVMGLSLIGAAAGARFILRRA